MPQREGSLLCQTAGVRLVPEGNRLRLRDAATDQPLPWADEEGRRADEERRLREVAERQVETERQRNRALEEELARLRGGAPGR